MNGYTRRDLLHEYIAAFLSGIIVGMLIIFTVDNTDKTENNDVNNNVIDSLIAVNDTIKIKVEKLDSIKDAKVIEVSTLDNDSTLKLFHELVSE
jgi:hypothetical protein